MTAVPNPALAVEAAKSLFAAVRQGDEEGLWALFATEARRYIVARGIHHGMSAGFGAELLAGTANPRERERFLVDVLGGIEKDLERVDLDRLVFADEPEALPDDGVRVRYLERFFVPVGPPLDPLPVGSVELVAEDGEWRIAKIVPRPG